MPQQNNLTELTNFVAELLPIAEWPKAAADGSASTATAETSIGVVGSVDVTTIPVGPVTIHPSAAVVASDTNYATIQVFKRTNGGAGVLLAQGSTSITVNNPMGNWAAWVPINLTVQAGAFVTPGDAITVVITKTGTGVVIPQLYLAAFSPVK